MASLTVTIQVSNGAPNTHAVTRTITTPQANRILSAYRDIYAPDEQPPPSDAEVQIRST